MLTTGIPDVFQSHHEVMDALDQNFAGSDDAQRAMAVNKLREDMTTACQRQEDDAKTAILGTHAKPLHTTFENPAPACVQSCLSKCERLKRKQLPRRLLKLINSGFIVYLSLHRKAKRMWTP